MKPILEKVYCYRPSENLMEGVFKKLNVRKQEMNVIKNGKPEAIKSYRYAKTITVEGQSRTLLMISEDKDEKRVNKSFATFKKKIEDDVTIQNVFLKAEAKPLLLDLKHEY